MGSTSQKFFSEVCSLTARTPTSVASLMRTAGYGFEKDVNNDITTQPSLDSFIGAQCIIIPVTATIFMGHDQYVCNTALAGPPRQYQGVLVPVLTGVPSNLLQPMRGIIDANAIWLYTVATQNVNIVFVAV